MGWVISPTIIQEERARQDLLEQEKLSYLRNSVASFIEAAPHMAYLKEAQTGVYILGNELWSESFGTGKKAADLYGLTAADLSDGIYTQWDFSLHYNAWKDALPGKVEKLESQAATTKRPVSHRDVGFIYDGSIIYENIIKIPLLNYDNSKTIAILTYCHDLTAQLNLSSLFKLYLRYYPHHQAIVQLLKYLSIDYYFVQLPTVRELEIFFALYQHKSRKRISRYLNISCNTVACHIQHLKEKLLKPDIDEVLVQLRKGSVDIDEQYL